MEKIQFCYIHSTKPAKRYCKKCNVNICNDCAIENHSNHIDECVKLTNEDNFYNSLIKSFISKSKSKITNTTCSFNSSHVMNSFCSTCNQFYCGKCDTSTHSSHLNESLDNFYVQLVDILKLLLNISGNERAKCVNVNNKELTNKVTVFEHDMKNIIIIINKVIDTINQRNKDIECIIDNNKRSFIKVMNTYQGMKDIENMQMLYDKLSYGNNLQKFCDILNNFKSQFENGFNNDDEINKFATLITNINTIKEITNESNLKLITLLYDSFNNFKYNDMNNNINQNINEYHKDTNQLINETNNTQIKPHFTYSTPQANNNNTSHSVQFKHIPKVPSYKTSTPHSQAVKTGHDVNKLKQIFEKNSQPSSTSSIPLSKKNTNTMSSSMSISHPVNSPHQEESNIIKSRPPGTPLDSNYVINPGNVKEQITRNVDMYNKAEEKNARTSDKQVKVNVTKPNCYQNAPTKLSTPFNQAKSVFDTGVAMNVNNIGPLASMTNTIQQSQRVKHIPTMMEEISNEKNNQTYRSESTIINSNNNKPQQETSSVRGFQKSYSISENKSVNSIKNIFEQGELRNKEQKSGIEKKTSYTYNKKESTSKQETIPITTTPPSSPPSTIYHNYNTDNNYITSTEQEIHNSEPIIETTTTYIEQQQQQPLTTQSDLLSSPRTEPITHKETETLISSPKQQTHFTQEIEPCTYKNTEQEETIPPCSSVKIQLMAAGQNCNSLFVFDSTQQTISELELDTIPTGKFLLQHASLNIIPHIYISGGLDDQSQSSDSFYCITKNDFEEHSFSTETLSCLNIPRCNHTMVYYPEKKIIFAISGTRNNSCEKYSFSLEFWSLIPELKYSRENATTLIYNNSLYVFFGYDKEEGKFCTSIERLDISEGDYLEREWELIEPNITKNLSKRMDMGYVMKKDSVLLLGGVNNMRNNSNTVIEYNFANENGGAYNDMTLPVNCAFMQGCLIPGTEETSCKRFFGFTSDFKIIECYIDGKTESFKSYE